MNDGIFRISIRAARVNAGYSDIIAAQLLNVGVDDLKLLEVDCSKVTIGLAIKICKLYQTHPDRIYWGKEEEHYQRLKEGVHSAR